MTDLEVVCYTAFNGWNCHVTVADDDGSKSEHSVAVTRDELQRYSADADVHLLVNASFLFLLSKEPKESILPRFKLSDIERYFPDYAGAISARLAK